MTILDRTTTSGNFPAVPAGDAHLACAALHLILATHPELVEIPFAWRIDPDAVIRPQLAVDHPDAIRATELLAAALELPVQTHDFTGVNGKPRRSLTVEGRWGGAEWSSTQYTSGAEQAPALRAVTS